jgi:hypothetical protein
MSHIFSTKTRLFFLLFGLIFFLSAAGILTVKITSQSKRAMDEKNILTATVEKSAAFQPRVIENDDAPLRITEAKAKEVSAVEFTRLTGVETRLSRVSSVPEVTVRNASDKRITSFKLVIRDPEARITRALGIRKVSILPGETLSVGPQQRIDSDKYWIPFAERSNFYVTIGVVNFDDGTSWMIREGGEIK